jgi:hypothetical protein
VGAGHRQNRHLVIAIGIAIAALGCALTAFAHRAPGSLTTIEWNPATERTEIIHRLHSHDAELGIGAILDMPDLSVLDLEGRAYIALYVEERFRIADDNGDFSLALIGAELAGDHVLVFQELRERLPGKFRVYDGILRDIYPTQINQVNIEDGGAVHSLAFANNDDWHPYESQQ